MQHAFNSSHFEHVRNTIQTTFGNLIHLYNAYTDGMKYFYFCKSYITSWCGYDVMKLELQTVKLGW